MKNVKCDGCGKYYEHCWDIPTGKKIFRFCDKCREHFEELSKKGKK